MIILLPDLYPDFPRRCVKWPGESTVVILGAWKKADDGTVTSGYTRAEFMRALGVLGREGWKFPKGMTSIVQEVFG